MTLDLSQCNALVLNADYRPMSLNPLSTHSWIDSLKGVLSGKFVVVLEYDRVVRSPTLEMRLPSVVMQRSYVDNSRMYRKASLTRWNLFTAYDFRCNFCAQRFATRELTFEHVIPKARGGLTTWDNLVPACYPCNLRKGCRTPEEARMPMRVRPYHPTGYELELKGLENAADHPIPDQRWLDVIYWKGELQP